MKCTIREIRADPGSLVPYLIVPADLGNTESVDYRIHGIQGVLHYVTMMEQPVGRAYLFISLGVAQNIPEVKANSTNSTEFLFPLAPWILDRLEQRRQKDIMFRILIYWQGIRLNPETGEQHDYYTGTDWSIEFEVPQSRWLDILEHMGYSTTKIFELPRPTIPSEDPFTQAIHYLEQAQRMYGEQNYKEVLDNCRQCHEELKKIWDNRQMELEGYLNEGCQPKAGYKNRSDKFSATQKTLFQFCHMGPHSGYFVERKDAELALFGTLSAAKYLFATIEEMKRKSV